MTTILKSNNAYGGASTLSNVGVITKTATDLYADYAARVTADGGIVSDPAECQAAIQAALDGDYYYRTAAAICARWGRKVVGANITKLYSLRGVIDAIATGTLALDTTTVVGEQLADLGVGDSLTLSGLTVLASGATGLAVLHVVQGAVNAFATTSFTPAAEAWEFLNGSTFVTMKVATVSKFASNPDYTGASLEAQAIMAEMDTLRTTGFTDGAVRKVMSPAGGFTPIAAGAAANVAIASGNTRSAEWWLFNDVSGVNGVNALMRATTDAGARY